MFTAYITDSQITTVKSDLLYHTKEHKLARSSHLTEALAFSVGFNTNAAMLEGLRSTKGLLCVEFCSERFWRRLSELSGTSTPILQSAFNISLPEMFSRAIGTRDLRGRITLPLVLKLKLDRFFKTMADHGAAYFTIEGYRPPPNELGFGGFYRVGKPQAMRPIFTEAKPSLYWQWDDASWNALMADDFLEDHAGSKTDLTRWASDASSLLERDLSLGNVVFDAKIGLVVHHEEIEGCTTSIVYQRAGQAEAVEAADARQEKAKLQTV